MRICCNTHNGGNIPDKDGNPIRLAELKSLETYFNVDSFKNIRRQMMNGERPEHCHNCFMVEDHGGRSLREIYLDRFISDQDFQKQLKSTKPDGTIDPRVTYLDFSLSNKCNLKCVMCAPSASTILSQDFDALKWDYDKEYYRNAEDGWKDEEAILRSYEACLPTLQEMLFTGGEPLISQLHMRILEKAIASGRSKNILLRYHSNCTNIPQRLLEVWKEFKVVDLHASVEGVGEMNNYIRYGSDFKTVETNIRRIAELPNTNVEVHTCFQIPTLLNLPSLHRWVEQLHPRIPTLPYHIWVNHPDWLEAYNLREDLKKLVRKRLEESLEKVPAGTHTEWVVNQKAHVSSLLNRMDSRNSDPAKWHEFKHRISELESLRNNSLKSLCPELFA